MWFIGLKTEVLNNISTARDSIKGRSEVQLSAKVRVKLIGTSMQNWRRCKSIPEKSEKYTLNT